MSLWLVFLVAYAAVGLGVFLQFTVASPERPSGLFDWAFFCAAFVFLVAFWPLAILWGVTRVSESH